MVGSSSLFISILFFLSLSLSAEICIILRPCGKKVHEQSYSVADQTWRCLGRVSYTSVKSSELGGPFTASASRIASCQRGQSGRAVAAKGEPKCK